MANPAVTYTFTNGTASDATQVNQNFTDIINGITDGTKDLSISALTCAGTATFNGNVRLGNSTVDDVTVTGSLASTIPIKTTNSFNIGSSTLGLAGIYFGSSAGAFTTRVVGGAAASSFTITLPTAVPSITGMGIVADTLATLSFRYPDKFTAVKTANYTATGDETVIPCNPTTGGASFTVTLPAASTMTGKRLTIKKLDNDLAKTVTIDGNASETIDGETTYVLYTQYESVTILCDGSNWHVEQHFTSTQWSTYTPTFAGMGTVAGVEFYWRREGNGVYIRGIVTSGTSTATPITLTLPGGSSIDTGVSGAARSVSFGQAWTTTGTATGIPTATKGPYELIYISGDATTLAVADIVDSDTTFFNANNATSIVASGGKLSFTSRHIPISGWKP